MYRIHIAILMLAACALSAQTQNPPLQKGISVQMAQTTNAAAVPEADSDIAWIITLTSERKWYFGIDPVTPESLVNKMATRPRDRDAKLYIKADARASLSDVENVLQAGRKVSFEDFVLLTSQVHPPVPGVRVAPSGYELQVVPSANGEPVVLQIVRSARQATVLRLNNQSVRGGALSGALVLLLKDQKEKKIVIQAAGPLTFADFVEVLDICGSTGAKLDLVIPES